jgi:cobaltochelatase CobS
MSKTTPTIEALRKAAEEKVRAGKTSFTAPTAPADSSTPAPTSEWPDVLRNLTGIPYSTLFPEWWNSAVMTDFNVPVADGYEYPAWMRAYIPTNSDYNAEPSLIYKFILAFSRGSVCHVVGHPGTGKSEGLPKLLASRVQMPLFRMALNKKGMMFDDLIGRESIVVRDGHTITEHKDGLLVKVVQHPTLVLLDEFARANMEIQSGCMSLMERGGKLIVENRPDPVVPKNPGCWVFASDNVKGLGDASDRMVGTELVDGAVLDRFDITIEVDYLDQRRLAKLIDQWVPGIPDSMKLAQFATLVQDAYKRGNLPLSLSPRGVRAIAEYACIYRDYAPAVRDVYLCKLADEADKSCVSECFRTVFARSL